MAASREGKGVRKRGKRTESWNFFRRELGRERGLKTRETVKVQKHFARRTEANLQEFRKTRYKEAKLLKKRTVSVSGGPILRSPSHLGIFVLRVA